MHRLWRYDVFRYSQNDVAPLRSAMMRCLPLCARRHTSLGEADIISKAASFAEGQISLKKAKTSSLGVAQHHLPKANIIQKTHLSLGRQRCVFCWWTSRDLHPSLNGFRWAFYTLSLFLIPFPCVSTNKPEGTCAVKNTTFPPRRGRKSRSLPQMMPVERR